MTNFPNTHEQQLIIDAAVQTRRHMIVNARAGAAKTTTLIKVAEALPKASGLCLAFNTSIRDELKDRMPPNFKAMTLNGCGFNAWRRYIGKPTKVDKDKTYNILNELIREQEKKDADKLWENFAEIKKAISLAKTAGYLPIPPHTAFRPLCGPDHFYDRVLPFEAEPLEREIIDKVLQISWEATRNGVLDFDDMLLAPAVAGVSFDPYSDVLVDEAQDLSAINHVLIKKIVRGQGRLLAVGDPCQAIYGFRGADSSSMSTLGELFSADSFYLTTSFRCSKAVTRNAQWRAPDMNSPDWAAEGSVKKLDVWTEKDIPDGSAIICRNNAPLFHMAIRLLRAGRYPELAGRDIIKNVVTKMKKLGPAKLNREQSQLAVKAFVESEKLRQRDHKLVHDMAECMLVFINETDTLGDACAFAQKLGTQSGRLYLMTGHGSKGLEFENVFFLDQHLIDIKAGQDNNLKYVIETRAKLNLTYITSEGYIDDSIAQERNECAA